MTSGAKSVGEYLDGLPPDRREAIKAVRKTVLANLPKGYAETMQYGMISYVVPLEAYPDGYLGDKKTPLPYASLASQKNHMAVYHMGIYGNPSLEKWFREAWRASGKKLDMGKSCIRFKKLEDLALGVIGQAIAKTPVDAMIAAYRKARKK